MLNKLKFVLQISSCGAKVWCIIWREGFVFEGRDHLRMLVQFCIPIV